MNMKYISLIDQLALTKRGNYIAKPEEGFGLLKWKIRLIKAWAVLQGKADAIIYFEDQK